MADQQKQGQVQGLFGYLLARHGGPVALLTCPPNEVCFVHPREVTGATFFVANSWRHFGSMMWVCPPRVSTQHFCTFVKLRVMHYQRPTPHMVVYSVCQTCRRYRAVSVAASFHLACFLGQTMPIERVCEAHYDLKRSDMAHHFCKLVKAARKWRRLTTKSNQAGFESQALQASDFVDINGVADQGDVGDVVQGVEVGFVEFFDATPCILDASQHDGELAVQSFQHVFRFERAVWVQV